MTPSFLASGTGLLLPLVGVASVLALAAGWFAFGKQHKTYALMSGVPALIISAPLAFAAGIPEGFFDLLLWLPFALALAAVVRVVGLSGMGH